MGNGGGFVWQWWNVRNLGEAAVCNVSNEATDRQSLHKAGRRTGANDCSYNGVYLKYW